MPPKWSIFLNFLVGSSFDHSPHSTAAVQATTALFSPSLQARTPPKPPPTHLEDWTRGDKISVLFVLFNNRHQGSLLSFVLLLAKKSVTLDLPPLFLLLTLLLVSRSAPLICFLLCTMMIMMMMVVVAGRSSVQQRVRHRIQRTTDAAAQSFLWARNELPGQGDKQTNRHTELCFLLFDLGFDLGLVSATV
jgi:hypothetical protein